jgi:hypothetical protein
VVGGGAPADDPFTVLGLPHDADASAVRRARRRLARDLHPDRGGDEAQMQALNAAFDRAMALLGAAVPPASAGAATVTAPQAPAPSGPPPTGGGRRWVERDEPSFVIEALPVESFEALLVVSTWMGDVLIDEPPYLLEVHVREPAECWCRLELLPDAGATTVMLTVAGIEGVTPSIEVVRDAWIANLNQLGRAES